MLSPCRRTVDVKNERERERGNKKTRVHTYAGESSECTTHTRYESSEKRKKEDG